MSILRYAPHEVRPRHPATGAEAAGYKLTDEGKRLPYWRKVERSPEDLLAHPEDRWYSTAEVAKIIGRSTATVRGYLERGDLPGRRAPSPTGRRLTNWFVNGADLLAFMKPRPELAARASLAGAAE